LVGGKVEFEF